MLRLLKSVIDPKRSSEDRSFHRYRNAILTGTAASLGRAISIVTSVLTVRLTYNYLGAERYGMWMTITAVIAMFGFADFGMSNGLINIVANAFGHEDEGSARRAISSTFFMLCLVAALLIAGGAVAYSFLPAARIFNVNSPVAMQEAGPALIVFFLCFVLQLPLGSVRGTQLGLQKGFHNNLWASLGTLSGLLAMLVAIRLKCGLPTLVLAVSGPPVLATILNGVELFLFSHPGLRPTTRAFSRSTSMLVLRTGMMYFLLQISFTVGTQTDNVVIAQILGATSVAAYAVPARMFNLITSFLVMVSGAMLPAYADAAARGDGGWIRKSFLRVMVLGTSCTVVAAGMLILVGNRVLAFWIGPGVQAPMSLLAMLGLQCIIYAYLQPISFLLNGIGKFRVQVIWALLNAVVNLGLSIFFVKMYGVIGAVMGTTISFLLMEVIPLTIESARCLKALEGNGRVQVNERSNTV